MSPEVSLIRTTADLFLDDAGDLNGDGRDDLAVSRQGLVTILFGDGRLPPETELGSLAREGRGVDVLSGSPGILSAAGGEDLDGDGLEDLAITVEGARPSRSSSSQEEGAGRARSSWRTRPASSRARFPATGSEASWQSPAT